MTKPFEDRSFLFTIKKYFGMYMISPLELAAFRRFLETPSETAVSISVGRPNPEAGAISPDEREEMDIGGVCGKWGMMPYILKINVDVLYLDPEGPMTEYGGKFYQFLQHFKASMEKYFSGHGQFRFRPDGGVWSTHLYLRPVRWIQIDRYGKDRRVPKALLLSVFPGESSSVDGQSSSPGLRSFVRSQLDADDQGLVAAHETGHLLGLKHPGANEILSQFGSNIMSSGGGLPCQLGIGTLHGINGDQFERILDGYEKGTLLGAASVDPDEFGIQFASEFVGGKKLWYPIATPDFHSDDYILPYLDRTTSDGRWGIRNGSNPDSTPTIHLALGQDLFFGDMVHNPSSPTIREEPT